MNFRRVLAFIGLLCLVPIGRGLMEGMLTIQAAAQRALTLVAIIWVLEHFVVPVVLAMAFPSIHQAGHASPAPDVVAIANDDES